MHGVIAPDVEQSTKLSVAAIGFRAVHSVITAGFLLAIGYVWWCALSGRRGRLLNVAITMLAAEGIVVLANGGDCPLGCVQDRLGDPVPLFELVLSPAAARRAVPVLGAATATGVAVVGVRNRSNAARACERVTRW